MLPHHKGYGFFAIAILIAIALYVVFKFFWFFVIAGVILLWAFKRHWIHWTGSRSDDDDGVGRWHGR